MPLLALEKSAAADWGHRCSRSWGELLPSGTPLQPQLLAMVSVKNSQHPGLHGQVGVPHSPSLAIRSLPGLIVGFEIEGLSGIGLNPGLEIEKIVRGVSRKELRHRHRSRSFAIRSRRR